MSFRLIRGSRADRGFRDCVARRQRRAFGRPGGGLGRRLLRPVDAARGGGRYDRNGHRHRGRRAEHSCAIQAGTGKVVCWGNDADGQATPPASVNGTAGTATAISAGSYHSCAIQAGTGNVVCWGDNANGETTPPPSVNGTIGTATAIAAGGSHSCAIQAGTGNVVCWGYDIDGQATPPRR